MNITTTREQRERYVLTTIGRFDIHAFQLEERWEFIVKLDGEELPEGLWEAAGSREAN